VLTPCCLFFCLRAICWAMAARMAATRTEYCCAGTCPQYNELVLVDLEVCSWPEGELQGGANIRHAAQGDTSICRTICLTKTHINVMHLHAMNAAISFLALELPLCVNVSKLVIQRPTCVCQRSSHQGPRGRGPHVLAAAQQLLDWLHLLVLGQGAVVHTQTLAATQRTAPALVL
jgi:hypothetical protein